MDLTTTFHKQVFGELSICSVPVDNCRNHSLLRCS
uniref:Uncharacterized protein n=1 Tax=Arundo donax TaxID=35708 RepID=A0A0A8YPM0_ARUDO